MNLFERLSADGAVSEARLIEKQIEYTTPKGTYTASVFVPDMSVADRDELSARLESEDETSRTGIIVSTCIFQDAKRTPAFTYEQACALRPAVADALIGAFNEVNFPKAKHSATGKSSSASSASRSAA